MAMWFNELVIGLMAFVLIGASCTRNIETPANPCPNIFQYIFSGNTVFGIITVNNATLNSTDSQITLEIRLSQPGVLTSADSLGYLTMATRKDQLTEHIIAGKPITYKLEFPTQNCIPQVTSIKVNGFQICSGLHVRGSGPYTILGYTIKNSPYIQPPENSRSGPNTEQNRNLSPGRFLYQEQPNQPAPAQPTSNQRSFNHQQSPSNPSFNQLPLQQETINFVESLNRQQINRPFSQSLFQQESLITQPFNHPLLSLPKIDFRINLGNPFLANANNNQPRNSVQHLEFNPSGTSWQGNSQPQSTAFTGTGNTNQHNPFLDRVNSVNENQPPTEIVSQNNLPRFIPANTTPPPARWGTTTTPRPQYDRPRVTKPTFIQSTTEIPWNRPNPSLNNANGINDYRAPGQNGPRNPPPGFAPTPPIKSTTPREGNTRNFLPTPQPMPTETNYTVQSPQTRLEALNYINSICGEDSFTKYNIQGKIITKPQIPWNAAIFLKENNDYRFLCSGSLISKRTLVSAAHCFEDFDLLRIDDLVVSVGRHNLFDWSKGQNVEVENVIMHPQYKSDLMSLDADLAILWLKESVGFSSEIKPVCIWQGPSDARDIEGMSAMSVNWGSNRNSSSTVLPQFEDVTILSKTQCFTSKEHLITSTSNQSLCAGNPRAVRDTCAGNSGSGIVIKNRNKWMLRGTTSLHFKTLSSTCNALYSDVAMFADWIKSNMLI